MRILISRTDSIGDVVLTLPLAGVLKQQFPDCYIIFLGRNYTRPVIEACRFVDEFVDWGAISLDPESCISHLASLKADVIIHVFPDKEICKAAKKAGIPLRIATAGRAFTVLTCNKLKLISRRNSGLHEAQLNLKLLSPLGISREFSLEEIPQFYGLTPPSVIRHPSSDIFQLILHPRSKGSAREWGLENFGRLIELLPAEKFNILVTGTKEEGDSMREFLIRYGSRITDLTGKLTLPEFLSLIGTSDGLVAASTGPLHLAAALGKKAIGLYAPMRPIFPKRWAPLGINASYVVLDKKCSSCRKNLDCECIRAIRPEEVAGRIYENRG